MKDVVLKDRSTSNYGLNPGTDKHLEHLTDSQEQVVETDANGGIHNLH